MFGMVSQKIRITRKGIRSEFCYAARRKNVERRRARTSRARFASKSTPASQSKALNETLEAQQNRPI